jgi:hypothetical protein
VRRIANPTYQFEGSATSREHPTAKISTAFFTYDQTTGQQSSTPQVSTYSAYTAPLTLFVLSNTTEADGRQRLTFTLSKCIAIDKNPAGFCDRLRTSTSPLFVACVPALSRCLLCAAGVPRAPAAPPPPPLFGD